MNLLAEIFIQIRMEQLLNVRPLKIRLHDYGCAQIHLLRRVFPFSFSVTARTPS